MSIWFEKIKRTFDLTAVGSVAIGLAVMNVAFGLMGFLFPLIVIVGGTTATLLGAKRKLAIGIFQKPRTWKNALGNAGVSGGLAIASILIGKGSPLSSTLALAFIASLSTALSDTVSSEVGMAFGSAPRLITSLQRVPVGENGAVSFVGLLVGLLAAACLPIVANATGALDFNESVLAAVAGFLGNILDSILGGTMERRGKLNNHTVNFLSTLFAAFSTIAVVEIAWK